jgi:hypothetical protein
MTDDDERIESEFAELMTMIARGIDNVFNGDRKERDVGFCLMLFRADGRPGRCNIIGNVSREHLVTMMREEVASFDQWSQPAGHA